MAALEKRLQVHTEEAPDQVQRVLAASDFVRRWLARIDDGALVAWAQTIRTPLAGDDLRQRLEAVSASDEENDTAFMAGLRQLRNHMQAAIVWRAIVGADDVPATLAASSALADACIEAALARAQQRAGLRFGTPMDDAGNEVAAVVLGMGKLGGVELNFSSDVDLIFFYTAPGECDGRKQVANEQYFAQVVQLMTRYLAEVTEDGFVYRVDWALRPFGGSGPPAMHFAAAEDYYQSHGREWERYAMVKARPVAGDPEAGRELMAMLRPFVYRRYLDYTAIESLRELKARIADDAARRQQQNNVKLSRGGIRDLEFVAQAFQLIRGGQEEALRATGLRDTLVAIARAGHLPKAQVAVLDEGYLFLRRLENALQMRRDAQTHALPETSKAQSAIAQALDTDWEALTTRLASVREQVSEAFDAVFAGPRVVRAGGGGSAVVDQLWQGSAEPVDMATALVAHMGDDQARDVVQTLVRLRDSKLVRELRDVSQRRLGDLLAQLVAEAEALEHPGKALTRALQVIEQLAGRGTYVSLLRESPTARAQLLRLCMASPWIAHLLARQPMLLDQLLDARVLYEPPERETMQAELQRRLSEMPEEDTEARMNLLRRYRQEVMLRVAAADGLAGLPLPKVSDRLTWLAEIIVETAIAEVRREMVNDYGVPYRSDGVEAGFGVIGYGKFGGIEMGYGSDLDVVFLHDCDEQDGETRGGGRSIANAVWFSRLAQRLVHWLSTQTAAGRVYEVDLQLRPSGSAGLLVTSLDAFAHYQREKAWTWEHQALVRARFVCGDAAIGDGFTALRRELLCRHREPESLATEIRDMRSRMRTHRDTTGQSQWDLKQGEGGLTDLEFVTQYLVLAHAAEHPSLCDWSDQWRQSDAIVAAGLLDAERAEAAIAAYRELRALVHARALDEAPATAALEEGAVARETIQALWRDIVEAVASAAS